MIPIVLNITLDAHKYKSCHHELKDGEIWLGNTPCDNENGTGVNIPKYCSHLKTVRLGKQAYCIKGTPLSRSEYLPLIIHKSEEADYDRIMMGRFNQIKRS